MGMGGLGLVPGLFRVARPKEAERRAIIIGEKQRKGQYKLSHASQAQQVSSGSFSRFLEGFKSAIRSK